MYTLKASPEDFLVEEIYKPKLEEGTFAIIKAKKTNITTFKLIELLAKSLQTSINNIGYAGVKDKHAITTQYLSIKNASKKKIEQLSYEGIEIAYLGQAKRPIELGDLEGNRFTITIRNLEKPLKQIANFPNYFDQQRFSENNIEIGKALLQKKYQKAAELYCTQHQESHTTKLVKTHLQEHPTDAIGAIRQLQPKLISLMIGSYQSFLFNRMLAKRIQGQEIEFAFGKLIFPEKMPEIEDLPLVGFDTELTQEIEELLAEDELTPRSFIIRSIPQATQSGAMRPTRVQIKDLECSTYQNKTQTVSFTLPKGAYATMAIKAMYY